MSVVNAFAIYLVAASLLATVLGRYLASLSVEYPEPPRFDVERAYRTLCDPANRPTHPAPATNSGKEVRRNA